MLKPRILYNLNKVQIFNAKGSICEIQKQIFKAIYL